MLLKTNTELIVIRRIILPQILPGLFALALLIWSETWNMVGQLYILLLSQALQLLSIYYDDILGSTSGGASAVIYALPVILIHNLVAAY